MYNNGFDKTISNIEKNKNYRPNYGSGNSGGQWFIDNAVEILSLQEKRQSIVNQYRYWPDYGLKAINVLDITSTPKTNLINDADFVGLSAEKKAAFNAQKLNKSTKTADLASSSIITDDTRIANHNLVRWKGVDTTEYEKSNTQRGQGRASNIRLNNAQGKPFKIPIDPLILDLNGDGVKTVSYTEKPVLFDIDNDGGSLEETGWLSHQDGLLVRDLNNNGKIDNMAEVFSEYYAGRAAVR